MPVVFTSHNTEQTHAFGLSAAQRISLRPEWGKIVLLSGEVGAGKTTFTQSLLKGLDISESGKSPTFSYLREYESRVGKVIHADFYRLAESGNPAAKEAAISELQERVEQGAIVIVEWFDLLNIDPALFFDQNTLQIQIHHGERKSERNFAVTFWNAGSIAEKETRMLMDEFYTPVHVRKHIEKVTAIAVLLAEKLFAAGVFLDVELVRNAALCHDLVRYVDFSDFDDLSRYQEEVSPEKLQFWKDMHTKYEGTHHGDAIADILNERGFYATAAVAESHMTGAIFRSEPFSWEEKLVYYADKRALHDTIVSLKKRFADGRKRYGHEANPELEKKVFALEKEIFSQLDIRPEDIQ